MSQAINNNLKGTDSYFVNNYIEENDFNKILEDNEIEKEMISLFY